MDYFQFYNIPLKFQIDKDLLRLGYLENSKKFHPDFYVNESESAREAVLIQSTFNNNAYKTLNNDHLRMKYILELEGVLVEGEKESLSQDFLMEMMDVNEEISLADKEGMVSIREKIASIESGLNEELQKLCDEFDATGDHELLQAIKVIYLKKRYLWRIMERE